MISIITSLISFSGINPVKNGNPVTIDWRIPAIIFIFVVADPEGICNILLLLPTPLINAERTCVRSTSAFIRLDAIFSAVFDFCNLPKTSTPLFKFDSLVA